MKLHTIALAVTLAASIGHDAQSQEPPTGHRRPPPIELPDYPDDSVLPSDPLGYLPASSSVGASGEFNYTIPIEVPAGRAGLAPEISLNYSSRGGNGIAGVGWSLSAYSTITWCPTTVASEGYTDGAEFGGPNDRFCLDGEKLVTVNSGVYGDHGTEYRTERDRFAKIVSYGADLPQTFSVWTKDGKRLEYTSVLAHRVEQPPGSIELVEMPMVTAMWKLQRVYDRAGNYMEYEHTVTASAVEPFGVEILLSAIHYTAKDPGVTPTRHVEFWYQPRPDPYFEYQSGVRFETTQRLVEIRTKARAEQDKPEIDDVLLYLLDYEPLTECEPENCPATPAPSWRSRLSGVWKCDRDLTCGWQRQFTWEKQTPTFEVHDVPPSGVDIESYAVLVLDLDGDGRDDLLQQASVGGLHPTYARLGGPGGLGDTVFVGNQASGLNMHDFSLSLSRALDVDGDGASELYAVFHDGSAMSYALLRWDAAQSVFEVIGPIVSGPVTGIYPRDMVRVADLHGDGRPDVLRAVNDAWVYQENVDGQLAGDIQTGVTSSCFERTRVMDLDGDGRSDVLGFESDECTDSHGLSIDDNYVFSASNKWKLSDWQGDGILYLIPNLVFADVNGDGLRDAVTPGGVDFEPRLAWNSGNGFASAETIASGPHDELWTLGTYDEGQCVSDCYFSYGEDGGNRPADVNGDGLEDIVSFRRSGNDSVIELHLAERTSAGEWGFRLHVLPQSGGRHVAACEQGLCLSAGNWSKSQLGDFNGDGLVDIVQVSSLPYQHHFEVLLQQPAVGDVITTVSDEDALSPRELVSYSTTWAADTASPPPLPTCSFPQVCIKSGIAVVREHSMSQGHEVAAYRRRQYDYWDPRSDMQGRGFLGFGKVRARDPDFPQETITWFDNVTPHGTLYPFAGLPAVVRTITPIFEQPGNPLPQPPPGPSVLARVTQRTTMYYERSLNQGKTYVIEPQRWTTLEWEANVLLTPDGIEVPAGPPVVLRRREGSSSYDDYGNLLTEQVTTVGGVVRTKMTSYSNNPALWLIGLPETIDVSVTDTTQAPVSPRHTELDHDPQTGLLEEIRVQPGDPDVARTTHFYYTPEGLVDEVSDFANGEPMRWTYLEYDDEGVFVTQRYNDLELYEVVLTQPGLGVPVLVQDPHGVENGKVTKYAYDGFGRPRGVWPDGGESVEIFYGVDDRGSLGHPHGVVVAKSHGWGGSSIVYEDELGRPWERSVKAFDGIEWINETIDFNVFGSVIRRHRPGLGTPGSAAVEVTDTLGRPVFVRQPDLATTTFEYTGLFEKRVKDPDGRTRITRTDADDRVVQSADLVGTTEVMTRFFYEEFDQVHHTIGPDGVVTWFGYDAGGRRDHLNDQNSGVTDFTYNGFGEPTSETNAEGEVTTYFHDVLGRVYQEADFEGTTTFTWDANGKGKLASTLSTDGVATHHEYDAFGRSTLVRHSVGTGTYDVEATYDATTGQPKYLLYPDPQIPGRPRFVVEQRYKPTGYVESAWDVSTSHHEPLYEIKSRNADLNPTRRTLGEHVTTDRDYDPLTGRLDKITSTGGGGDRLPHRVRLLPERQRQEPERLLHVDRS